jgi:hypothetical protein
MDAGAQRRRCKPAGTRSVWLSPSAYVPTIGPCGVWCLACVGAGAAVSLGSADRRPREDVSLASFGFGGLSCPRPTLARDWPENLLWPRIFFSADRNAMLVPPLLFHTIPYQTAPDLNSLPSLDLAGPR